MAAPRFDIMISRESGRVQRAKPDSVVSRSEQYRLRMNMDGQDREDGFYGRLLGVKIGSD
jgi:hypothetical protein